jgi:hypothetical protein
MECMLALLLLAALPAIPLARMLFGKGPNSFRRLVRPDIAAFLVLTAGCAAAFAVARVEQGAGWLCILVLALPFALSLAWLGRYFLEDLSLEFGRRRSRRDADADLTFLNGTVDDAAAIQPVQGEARDQGQKPAAVEET